MIQDHLDSAQRAADDDVRHRGSRTGQVILFVGAALIEALVDLTRAVEDVKR
jgi:hypothetical protein